MGQQQAFTYNFIWDGGVERKIIKIKWDFLTQLVANGILYIIDLKAQFKTFLVKLLVQGVAHGDQPWKDSLKHKVEHAQPLGHMHSMKPMDINWNFITPKFCKSTFPFWNNILGLLKNVKASL